MALSVKRGTFTTTAGTGSQAITGVGFQPKVVFFWCVENTALGFGTHAWDNVGIGVSSSNRYCMSAYAKDGVVGSTTCYRALSNTFVIDLDDSISHVFRMDLTSLDADGFTVNKSINITSMEVHWLALGGADLSNVKLSDFAAPTSTGSFSVTGVGFKPDVVLMFGANRTAFNSTSDITNTVGCFASSTARWTSTMYAPDATATGPAKRAQRTDSCYLLYRPSDGTLLQRWDATSMDSDGFTCNAISVNGSGEQIVYLALKGGSWAVGSSAKPTGGAPQNQDIALGFPPLGVILQSFGLAATTSVSADARIARGSSDGTNHGSTWFEMQDAQTNSVADHDDSSSEALTLATAPSTVDAQCTADFTSVTNGLRLTWDVNNATAAEILYLAGGSTPAAPGLPDETEWIPPTPIRDSTLVSIW